MRQLVLSVLLLVTPLMAAESDDGKRKFPRIRLGGIMVGAGYSHWSGPYYGFGNPYFYSPYYSSMMMGPGWWGPWAWNGGFYPGFLTGYGFAGGRGEVKLNTSNKTAEVYIDGAFAGTAGKLKTMWLDPGVYEISVKPAYSRKVYVLGGKTLRLEVQ